MVGPYKVALVEPTRRLRIESRRAYGVQQSSAGQLFKRVQVRCLRADACASSHVAYSAELEGSVWNRVRPSTLPFALLQLVDLDCSSTACTPVQFRHLAFRIDKSLSWS